MLNGQGLSHFQPLLMIRVNGNETGYYRRYKLRYVFTGFGGSYPFG